MACVFFGLMVRQLLCGMPPSAALVSARAEFTVQYGSAPEFSRFRCILEEDFIALPEVEVLSGGYVLDTLHASLWCLMRTRNFQDCVLKAVNLGGDTDTTGCVAGGLAGTAYGLESISKDWIEQLPRNKEVANLFKQFANLCEG
jgi:ADP-ribosylglycohydrolase